MKWRDPNFRYFSSEQSRKPGYLARRFKHYSKAIQEQQQETETKVRPIIRKKA